MTVSFSDTVPVKCEAREPGSNDCITQSLDRINNKKCLLAYSGGCDSTALLYMCQEKLAAGELQSLRAVHVNHHLNEQADAWQQRCEQVCTELKIPLVCCDVHLQSEQNIESQARELRYAAIAEHLQGDEVLLTGHHQDDQAETLLLQLARGAGVQGLSAMPAVTPFANTVHMRPLLQVRHADLEAYLHEKSISWIDDSSNDDLRFARNVLRKTIIPAWQVHVPALVNNIARASEHCAEAVTLLDDFAERLLAECITADLSLSVNKLLQLTAAQQALVLRYFIQAQGFALPSTVKLYDALQQLHAKADAKVCVTWAGTELRRFNSQIWVLPPLPDDCMVVVNADAAVYMQCAGRTYSLVPKDQHAQFRHGGEKLYILEQNEHRDLKKYLQAQRVPPWLRDRLPLEYKNNQCIGVKGFAHESKP